MNPFSTFQRNQRFWMFGILFVTMVTFIACGFRGDLSERIIGLLGRRSGPVLVRVNGRSYHSEDLRKIGARRDMANDLMIRLMNVSLFRTNEKLKSLNQESRKAGEDAETVQKRQQEQAHFLTVQQSLLERKLRKRYFDGGAKLDDLAEFLMWKARAEKLGIRLTENHVRQLLVSEFFGVVGDYQSLGSAIQETMFNFHLRGQGEAQVWQGITDEFVVRIAQLSTASAQPIRLMLGDKASSRFTHPDFPESIRVPATPGQLYQEFLEKRSGFDVALLPVPVQNFLAKAPNPTDSELQDIFTKYRGKPYDPTSPDSGLQLPHKVRVAYVIADPSSPSYKAAGKALQGLETIPLFSISPFDTPVSAAVKTAGYRVGERSILERFYNNFGSAEFRTAWMMDDYFIPPILAYLSSRQPAAAASLAGQGFNASPGTLISYLSHGLAKHPNEVDEAIKATVEKRAPAYASLAASLTTGERWLPISLGHLMDGDDKLNLVSQRLPINVVEPQLRTVLESRGTESWAQDAMKDVRAKLKEDQGLARKANFERTMRTLIPKYGLTYGVMSLPMDQYSIGKAPELEPLQSLWRRSYDLINWLESRDATPGKLLNDDDFSKMFFGSENFSAKGLYYAMPWPPEVSPNAVQFRTKQGGMRARMAANMNAAIAMDMNKLIQDHDPNKVNLKFDLFEKAEKPAVYWLVEEQRPGFPDKLEQVKDQAVSVFKTRGARTEALTFSEELAKTLVAADLVKTLPEALKKAGVPEPIRILNVAKWARDSVGGRAEYVPPAVPKDKIILPRTDTMPLLLKLPKLTEPFKTGYNELDQANIRLFNAAPKNDNAGKFVQILTNESQSMFYISVVTTLPHVEPFEFFVAMFQAMPPDRSRRPVYDSFMAKAIETLGGDYRRRVIEEFHSEMGVYITDDAEERKQFDGAGGG